jgi:anti-anti-sigma factor
MSDEVTDEGPLRRELRPQGPPNLSTNESHHGDTTIIGVSGEFDVLTAPRVAGILDDLVRNRSGDVVLDLRETQFLDSTALAILLNAQRRLSRVSREMTVVCGPGPVRNVFEMARLTRTLGVVPSLEGLD